MIVWVNFTKLNKSFSTELNIFFYRIYSSSFTVLETIFRIFSFTRNRTNTQHPKKTKNNHRLHLTGIIGKLTNSCNTITLVIQ